MSIPRQHQQNSNRQESKLRLNNQQTVRPACKMKLFRRCAPRMSLSSWAVLLLVLLVSEAVEISQLAAGGLRETAYQQQQSNPRTIRAADNTHQEPISEAQTGDKVVAAAREEKREFIDRVRLGTKSDWITQQERSLPAPKLAYDTPSPMINDEAAASSATADMSSSRRVGAHLTRPSLQQPEEGGREKLIDVSGSRINVTARLMYPAHRMAAVAQSETLVAGKTSFPSANETAAETPPEKHSHETGSGRTTGSSGRSKRFNIGDKSDGLQMSNDNNDLSESSATPAAASNRSEPVMSTIGTTATTNTKSLKCRVEKNLYLDFSEYQHYSCAGCYNNMPKKLFWTKFSFKKENRIWLVDDDSGHYVLPNQTYIIRATFKAESAYGKWRDCCAKAIDCCLQNSIYLPKTTGGAGQLVDPEPSAVCPATWDGLGCWPESPAGLVAQHLCPDNVYFLGFMPVCRGTVTKQCFSNGSWFIRNDHEWSDYSNCAPLPLYATRMLIGSVWHVISAIVIGPALIVLNKFPNRGGSKRVRILSNLLFWLLLNGSMAAVHKIGVIGGIFLPGTDYDDQPTPPSQPVSSMLMAANQSRTEQSQLRGHGRPPEQLTTSAYPAAMRRQTRSTSDSSSEQLASWQVKLDKAGLHYGDLATSSPTPSLPTHVVDDDDDDCDGYNITKSLSVRSLSSSSSSISNNNNDASSELTQSEYQPEMGPGLLAAKIDYTSHINGPQSHRVANDDKAVERATFMDGKQEFIRSSSASLDGNNMSRKQPSAGKRRCSNAKMVIESPPSSTSVQRPLSLPNERQQAPISSSSSQPAAARGAARCKRSTPDQARPATQPAPVVFICWLLSLGIRITRLLGYAWMFTGAVYLCSILHFAPAEPPNAFIKWLMILTDGFPLTMGFVYLIARTIHEPSPLTLIVKLPYYYLIDNTEGIDELWATQLNCWMFRSKYDNIEDIADFPNLVLVILNAGLFVITLIIMCRISRPGCTRQVMSLGDYFKAAGTLVVLYGAHYALFAYRPTVEGCIKGQVMYYAFLFVDGIQGMAVSYVFCYRTAEGKEIIYKWLASCRDRGPKWCQLSDGSKNHHHHTNRDHENYKSSTHSTRSNNSACNGKDVTTELIDVDENPIGSQF